MGRVGGRGGTAGTGTLPNSASALSQLGLGAGLHSTGKERVLWSGPQRGVA